MSDTDTKASAPASKAAAAKPKAKRKNLTPAERIAKAEADLAALRQKAVSSDQARLSKLDEKIKAVTTKRDELVSQANALQQERASIVERLQAAEKQG